MLGVVHDPLRDEVFAAVLGKGATLNGQRIGVSTTLTLDQGLLSTGFPYDRRERASFYLRLYEKFLTRSQGIRRAGSAALDLCYVAAGRFDGFWEMKLHPWDVAAASLMVTEAGGTVTNFEGNPYSIYSAELLASNGLIHEQILVRVMREVANGK